MKTMYRICALFPSGKIVPMRESINQRLMERIASAMKPDEWFPGKHVKIFVETVKYVKEK